jgi:hypothetical protein
MHKYLILFFSVTLFLCACKSNGIPNGVLKPDQMVNLLTQIHIVDGSLYNGQQAPDSLYKYGTGKYIAVFERFHTDSGQFKKSLNFYSIDPNKLSDMYDQVDAKIKALSDSLNLLDRKQRKVALKADSLKADSAKKAMQKNGKAAAPKADSINKLKQKHPDALPKK